MVKLHRARKALAAYVEPVKEAKIDTDKALAYMLENMGKSYGIVPRAGLGTVEFRIFQAPNSPQEHELHVDFALAYVEWCEAQAKAGKVPQPSIIPQDQLKDLWPVERCKKEFNRFVKMIGLKPSKYKRYFANLERRAELCVNENLFV